MIKFTYLSLALASVFLPLSSQADVKEKSRHKADIMNWMPKASADPSTKWCGNPRALSPQNKLASAAVAREAEVKLNRLPSADDTGILDAPDMTIWFYTIAYDKELIKHEYYTETKINGFTVTIYNDKLEELGSFSDSITLEEGETAVARLEVGPQITRKFFNVDDKYEVMMALSINTEEYVNHYRTLVYQLNNNKPLMTIPGIYISAINTATDKWSEHFWLTFATEEEAEQSMIGNVINTGDYVYSTYKYAGYSGLGDPVLVNRVPLLCAPGEDAVTFLASQKDGKPYFEVNYLKYCWYLEPFNWEVEDPTPDNELIVDLYTLPDSYSSTPVKYSTTRLPLNATLNDRYFLMTGTFSYNNDLALDTYGDQPALIITKATWTNASEEYVYDYDVYQAAGEGEDAEAKHLFNIAKGCDGGIFMADVPGADPQILFIDIKQEEPVFNFVSLLTGETEHSLPYRIADGLYLTAETERVPHGTGYLYVASQTQGMAEDDGTIFHSVLYATPDGTVDHVDRLNLGKDVDMAQVYTGYDGFDPFIFNLDDRREYMVLIKRRNANGTGNHEELIVVSDNSEGTPLLTLGPDDELGNLSGISFANLGSENPALMVIYGKDDLYTAVSVPLPLTLFEGEGTVDNPYLITSAGGLNYLNRFPDAHYAIANDIDAAGYSVTPLNYTFSGSIDGRNHVVSNLKLEGRSLIPNMIRGSLAPDDKNICAVRNINFVNPEFNATVDNQGLVCGHMSGGLMENVHVYGGHYTSKGEIAGLVGLATLYSKIDGCSVNADISSSEGSASGIAIRTRTTSSINACAFKGSLTGTSEMGGILGAADNSADRVTNCHVNAKITGNNTIGGIVGSSSRALVANNYVEGKITAKAASRWGGGLKTGGVIGELSPWYPSESEPEQPEGAVVKGNVVALDALTGDKQPEGTYEGQNDTMHRIVGFSQINATPDEVDYDEVNNKPIYGDLQPVEKALNDNYVVNTIAKISDSVEEGKTTTEGASVEASAISRAFLESLGFAYGEEVASPWSYSGKPQLWFEGGLLIFTPTSVEVNAGRKCSLSLALAGEEITEDMLDSFTCDISDESVLEMSDMQTEGGAIILTFSGLKEGQVTVKAGLNGKTAEVSVKVNKLNSVTEIADTVSPLGYDGRTARATGCLLNVFAPDGTLRLTGHDTVDLTPLAGGIYIVTATDVRGNRTSLKVRR